MLNYYYSEDGRTVVAVLTIEETGATFKGKAKCSPTDTPNTKVGETIAKMRALKKYMKSELREAFDNYTIAMQVAENNKRFAKKKMERLKRTETWLNEYLKLV